MSIMLPSIYVLLIFIVQVLADDLSTKRIALLPPVQTQFTSSSIPYINMTRNLTSEVEQDYRFRLIGEGKIDQLGQLSEVEKGLWDARNLRLPGNLIRNGSVPTSITGNYSGTLRKLKNRRRLGRRQQPDVTVDVTSKSWMMMLFAPIAASSYCEADEIRSWTCTPCLQSTVKDFIAQEIITVDSECGELQAVIGQSASLNAITVTFRGSANVGNAICDINAFQCETSLSIGGNVHCGFLDSWKILRSQVFEKLKTLLIPGSEGNRAIYFIGHSLGGAIATIAAVDWFDNDGKEFGYQARNLGLLTYGCPRLFDTEAANGFESIGFGVSLRAVHNEDIVPHLPPQSPLYRHVFRQLFNREDGKIVGCDDKVGAEATNCANSVFATSITDHLSFGGIAIGCKDKFAALANDVYCQDTSGNKIDCKS